jgi:hypothetical protein
MDRRFAVSLVILLMSFGLMGLFTGCKSEVPDRDAPGGILSGSDYERLVSRNAGRDAGALVEPAKPPVVQPTTMRAMPTTAPATPASPAGATPAAAPAAPAAPAPAGGATPPTTGQ